MRKTAFATAALAALAATAALSPAAHAREKLTGEQQLAKLLEGRVAGEPVDCINPATTWNTRIIDKTAIVYDAGNVIYVNRPADPRSLDSDDVMVTEVRGAGQLCSVDIVRLHDRNGMWYRGFVGLEKFTPYRKVAAKD